GCLIVFSWVVNGLQVPLTAARRAVVRDGACRLCPVAREAPNRTPCARPRGQHCYCQPWGVAPRWCRRAELRGIQLTEVTAADVHVRRATRADVPGIVWVSTSSILPGEDVGFGGAMDSPFRDVSMLAAVWQDPNVVQGEEVLVAEMDGRIVGCATVEDRGSE